MKTGIKKIVRQYRKNFSRSKDFESEQAKENSLAVCLGTFNLMAQIHREIEPTLEMMRMADAYKDNGLTGILPNNEDTYNTDRTKYCQHVYKASQSNGNCDQELDEIGQCVVNTVTHSNGKSNDLPSLSIPENEEQEKEAWINKA